MNKNYYHTISIFLLLSFTIEAQPVVTGFLPLSGIPGSTVTINGSGFNTTPAGNTVFFGATAGQVTTASATQLTVTVPAGALYEPITVTTNGLTAASALSFTPVYAEPAENITHSSFSTAAEYTTGAGATGMIYSDLDGDGRSEMVVTCQTAGLIAVFRNTSTPGNISFAPRVDFAGGSGPYYIASGDFNGDGKPDLAFSNLSSSKISVLLNNSTTGNIAFATRQEFTAGAGVVGIAVGDISGDGKPDIVFSNYNANNFSVIRNISIPGTLAFAAKTDIPCGTAPMDIAVRELDGDGKPDVLVVGQAAGLVSVFRNTSIGNGVGFAAKHDYFMGSGTRGLVVDDLDGDGKADMVTANQTNNSISVRKNLCTPGFILFTSRYDSTMGTPTVQPQQLALGDIDGDGKADLAVTATNQPATVIYRNNSSGGFITWGPRIRQDALSGNSYIALGDLDGDGRPDLGIVNATANKVLVHRNIIAPKITGFSPAYGAAGTTVTITGQHFRTSPTENIVYFGAAKATVTSASATTLTVTVPGNATPEPLTVTTEGFTAYAPKTFWLTFNGGDSIIAHSFAALQKTNTPDATSVNDLALADFDGDGKTDVALLNQSNIKIYRNGSFLYSPSFSLAFTVSNIIAPASVTIGDFNGDGKPDMATANEGSNTVSYFVNTSTGPGNFSFNSFLGSGAPSADKNIIVRDMNADGRADIVSQRNTQVIIRLNKGTANLFETFDTVQVYLPAGTGKIAVADFDGDGRPDLLAGRSVRRNASNRDSVVFEPEINYYPLANVTTIAADLNGDGKPDLAELNAASKTIQFFVNNSTPGNISFTLQPNSLNLTGPLPWEMMATDLNGDGKPDIALANYLYESISVYANSGTGSGISFLPKVDYSAGLQPYALCVGDLDGDARPDMIVAGSSNPEAPSFNVLRFQPEVFPADLPSINSFTPESGGTGTVITISGSNFSPSPTSNKVYFGNIKADVLSASTNTLTVKVPVGAAYEPFQVVNGSGLMATSPKTFRITFPGAGPAFTASSFDPAKHFPGGGKLSSLTIGDLDGDGRNDVAVTDEDRDSVCIYRNTSIPGAVSFAPRIGLYTGTEPSDCVIADLNADGKPEILVANPVENQLAIFRNTSAGPGNISFVTPPVYLYTGLFGGTFGFPIDIAVRDFDGDGRPDIAVLNKNAATVCLFRNGTTAGSTFLAFDPKVQYNAGVEPVTLSANDIDGNGKPDLVVGSYNSSNVLAFSNTSNIGTISFTAGLVMPLSGYYSSDIALFNLNENSLPEIVISGNGNGPIYMKNTSIRGTHLFNAPAIMGAPHFSNGLSMNDMDGDGRPDMVTTNTFGGGAMVAKNNYLFNDTVRFANGVLYASGPITYAPNDVATGDIDGDGKPDIAIVTQVSPLLVILRNKTGSATPLCNGGGATLNSNLSGTVWQWQLSTDSGITFTNITDNSQYTGAGTATLQLNAIPSSYTGYQYRCISGSVFSQVFTIRFINSWTGAVNNLWENPANWSCGQVPDSHTDVQIGAGANVVVNSNVQIATLTVGTGAMVTVNSGYTVTVLGH